MILHGLRLPSLEISHGKAGNDQHSSGHQLPRQLLAEETNAEENSAERKEIRDHRCASGADCMYEIVGHDEGNSRAKDPKPNEGNPREGQLRHAEGALSDW